MSGKGNLHASGSLRYASTELIAVNDTNADINMTAYVYENGEKLIGSGLVPSEECSARYADPAAKRKVFEVVIADGSKPPIFTLKVLFKKYVTKSIAVQETTKPQVEETKEEMSGFRAGILGG